MEKILNPNLKFCWTKEIGQEQLIAEFYKKVDIGIFASTCENLPNVLEKMRLGLPLFFIMEGQVQILWVIQK